MAHTVFTLHYITSWFQSGVMFLPGRRLYSTYTQSETLSPVSWENIHVRAFAQAFMTENVQAQIRHSTPSIFCVMSA